METGAGTTAPGGRKQADLLARSYSRPLVSALRPQARTVPRPVSYDCDIHHTCVKVRGAPSLLLTPRHPQALDRTGEH